MDQYQIIETEQGLLITRLVPGTRPEDVAAAHGGVVVDPGPYRSYEDAYDALIALQKEESDDL